MMRYFLSPAAIADMEEIWDYTAHHWTADQADRYILGFHEACQKLADGRKKGLAVDDIRPGYRKLAVARHFLFYRVGASGSIEVIRILHQQMNVVSHLRR